jgi:ATP-dependent DNA ligase
VPAVTRRRRLRAHEIKRDGFRILARRDNAGVRLITPQRNDFTDRFPFIEMAANRCRFAPA